MDKAMVVSPSLSMEAPKTVTAGQWTGSAWQVLDLCCGLGGISLAARELGCQIIAGVDISQGALESFKYNFPNAQTIVGSITKKSTLENCTSALSKTREGTKTLIVSGPPCQGFSVAGPRANRDPRNRVLLAVARTIARLQPDAALIENVAALLGKRHRNNLRRFRQTLKKGGFSTLVLELNAVDYGVPQNRTRMICLATKTPLIEANIKAMLATLHTPTRTVREALAGLGSPPIYKKPPASIAFDVPNHVAMRHSQNVKNKIASLKPGTGPMSYRRLVPDKPSRTLISGNRAPPAHFAQPRSITVREAARLQGFPDSFEVKGTFANQMLHVTNAVPPPMARATIYVLLAALENNRGRDH